MNRKGASIGGLLIAFASIIVGLAIFSPALSGFVAQTTNTVVNVNETITAGDYNSTVDLKGRAIVAGTLIVYNATGDPAETVGGNNGTGDLSSNFTILDNQINSVGVLTSQLQTLDETETNFGGASVNVSYTFEPTTFIGSSGGRSLAGLILVFLGLAIGVIALTPAMNSIKEFVGM